MKEKNYTIDFLRIVMACLVVMIHAGSIKHDKNLVEFTVTEGVCRIAVPFFFVVSGYYLYSSIQLNKFSSWLSKIVKLYIFWSLMYIPFQLHGIDAIKNHDWRYLTLAEIPFNIFFGAWHLWFLPAIIIGASILNAFHDSSKYKLLTASISIYVVACAIWYLNINNIINKDGFWGSPFAFRNGFFFSFPLMCFGFLIAKRCCESVEPSFLSTKLALFLSLMAVIIEACIGYHSSPGLYDLTFSSAVASVCLTSFAMKRPRLVKIEVNGSSLSTNIYMIHMAFFLILSRLIKDAYSLYFLILCLTLISIFLLNKVKGFIMRA